MKSIKLTMLLNDKIKIIIKKNYRSSKIFNKDNKNQNNQTKRIIIIIELL